MASVLHSCMRASVLHLCMRASVLHSCMRASMLHSCMRASLLGLCSAVILELKLLNPNLHCTPPYPRTCRATQRNSSLGHPIIAVAGHCCGYKRCRPVGVHDAAEAIRLECDNVGNAHTVWQHRRRHCIVWGDARMLWPEQRELLHPAGTVQSNL